MASNFEIIKAHYAASDAKDMSGMMAPITQSTEWVEAAGFPYAGTYVGADAIVDGVFKRIGQDWDGFALKVDRVVDGGDTIVAVGTYSGVSRKTGKPMAARVVHVWDMEAGKANRFEQFVDSSTFKEAMS